MYILVAPLLYAFLVPHRVLITVLTRRQLDICPGP